MKATIPTTSALAKKLGVEPGHTILLVDAPPGVAKALAPLPDGARIAKAGTAGADVALVFVESSRDVARHAKRVLRALKDGGRLWMAYPKKSSGKKTDLTRDRGWSGFEGWDAVSLVAIDETWSALRFRPLANAPANAPASAQKPAPRGQTRFTFRVALSGTEDGETSFFTFPYDAREAFGTRARVPVRGTINGCAFRSSLSPMGGGRHLMPVNRALREAAGVTPLETVTVVLERDDAPRVVEPPEDLAARIAKSRAARAVWEKLSYTHQKEYAEWISGAKKPETRARRLAQAIAMLSAGTKSP